MHKYSTPAYRYTLAQSSSAQDAIEMAGDLYGLWAGWVVAVLLGVAGLTLLVALGRFVFKS